MDELQAIQRLMERVRRMEEADGKVSPLRQVCQKAEEKMLKVVGEKAPELVEPLRAIFLLQYGMLSYVQGDKERDDTWLAEMEKAQRFVMEEALPVLQQVKPLNLNYEIFSYIKDLVKSGSRVGIRRVLLGEYGEVDCILYKDLAEGFNAFKEWQGEGFKKGLTAYMAGEICRQCGFRVERTGEGWVVVLDEQDLRAIGKRFEQMNIESEERKNGSI